MEIDVVEAALSLSCNPNAVNYIKLAKLTYDFITGGKINKVVKRVGDAHIKSAITVASGIELEKDKSAAIHRILTHLESAFYLYADYYHKLPKMSDSPLFIITGIMSAISRTESVGRVAGELATLIAIYHKATKNDDSLVKHWLLDIPYENKIWYICLDENIIEKLLGKDKVSLYKAEAQNRYVEAAGLSGSYDDCDGYSWTNDL